jgi:hypothetical protein
VDWEYVRERGETVDSELGFLGTGFMGGVGGAKLYCIIWKNVLELQLADCALVAASRLANSMLAAG